MTKEAAYQDVLEDSEEVSIDLETLSDDELNALIEQARHILKTRKETQRQAAIDEIQRLATTHGLNVDIKQRLRRTRRVKRSTEPREPKYRNPDNPEQTWAGIGPKPKWLKKHVAEGGSLKELKVSRG
jgi:DNA-binding protein H-NS